jgi:hypothetical protein
MNDEDRTNAVNTIMAAYNSGLLARYPIVIGPLHISLKLCKKYNVLFVNTRSVTLWDTDDGSDAQTASVRNLVDAI